MLSVSLEKVNRKNLPCPLVLFPGSLGDLLCVLPALEDISRASGERPLQLAVRGGLGELVKRFPFASQAWSLDHRRFAQLFSSPHSIAEETSRWFSSRSQVFSWFGHRDPVVRQNLDTLVGGRVRSWAFFTGQQTCHASTYYLGCVEVRETRCPFLVLQEKDRMWLDAYWKQHRWGSSSRLLAIHPGSGGQRKRWAGEGFIQVARWWHEQKDGQVLILLGPAEEQEEKLWRRVGHVESALSQWQIAALLSRATLYLGNDSGVSHLAGAVGASGVVIFGPTDPNQWRPLGGMLSVIHNEAYRAQLPQVPGISLAEVSCEEVQARLQWQSR